MIYIGTSGWQYRHWRNVFYGKEIRHDAELEYYASRFRTVEANATFYRLPEANTFTDWAKRTPDDFVFAVKASRFLTHMKRLKDPKDPVARFMDRAKRLGRKLGPVLLQLPPNMKRDDERLAGTLKAFPRNVRVAVEFRHDSWFVDEVREVLSEHKAALCVADRQSKLLTPAWRTADWGYVRFHEGRAKPQPCYGTGALRSRVRLLTETWKKKDDVYVYFNNDPRGCALRDAAVFARLAKAAGLRVTGTPEPGEIELG